MSWYTLHRGRRRYRVLAVGREEAERYLARVLSDRRPYEPGRYVHELPAPQAYVDLRRG